VHTREKEKITDKTEEKSWEEKEDCAQRVSTLFLFRGGGVFEEELRGGIKDVRKTSGQRKCGVMKLEKQKWERKKYPIGHYYPLPGESHTG